MSLIKGLKTTKFQIMICVSNSKEKGKEKLKMASKYNEHEKMLFYHYYCYFMNKNKKCNFNKLVTFHVFLGGRGFREIFTMIVTIIVPI